MKPISEEVAEQVCNGVDIEGFEYYFIDYTSETFKGTELEAPVAAFRQSALAIRTVLKGLREKYEIGEA